ncbi:hypothetical protein CCACVL1_29983 [Corchorus capsularis]|uniref:Uncharacterized protein n=1 Tax=Corchorus capsularis TaxID=210143 RepID=A0A1R3FZ84_COCAP|nr:hypothetical protein CCACVL1_29983 [Corchorus capsularis]
MEEDEITSFIPENFEGLQN